MSNQYQKYCDDISGKEFFIIPVPGDGNCAFGSILKSLFFNCVYQDKIEFFTNFISGMVYPILPQIKEEFYLAIPPGFEAFITRCKHLNLLQKKAVPIDFNHINDLLCEFLHFFSACLRKSVTDFYANSNKFDEMFYTDDFNGKEAALNYLKTLNNFIDIDYCTPYLLKKKIALHCFEHRTEIDGCVIKRPAINLSSEEKNIEVKIDVLLRSYADPMCAQLHHFDAMIENKNFGKKLSQEIELDVMIKDKSLEEKSSVEANDKNLAKVLQIDELESSKNYLSMELFFKILKFKDASIENQIRTLLKTEQSLVLKRKCFAELERAISEKGYTEEFADHLHERIKKLLQEYNVNQKQSKNQNCFWHCDEQRYSTELGIVNIPQVPILVW